MATFQHDSFAFAKPQEPEQWLHMLSIGGLLGKIQDGASVEIDYINRLSCKGAERVKRGAHAFGTQPRRVTENWQKSACATGAWFVVWPANGALVWWGFVKA